MKTIASLRRMMLYSICAALVGAMAASQTAAQGTPMMGNAARVALYAIDAETGDLQSVAPTLDSAATKPVDRRGSADQFAVDAQGGDLVGAPGQIPIPAPGLDRSADVANTQVDASDGDLLSAAPTSQDSGGAIDRSTAVAATSVDSENGDLLAAASNADLQAGDDYPFMVRTTTVDAQNGALIAGPPRFIVPEPAPPLLIAASVLLLRLLRKRR